MEVRRTVKYTVLCLLFIVLGFGSGYLTSMAINSIKESDNKLYNKDIRTYRPQQTIVDEEIEETKKHYLLKNENNILSLYEISGEERRLIKETGIDTFFLPEEDIKKLNNGIQLSTIEEGFELIEDFTS